MTENTEYQFDALVPPDMALRARQLGVRKAGMDFYTTLMLAVLAGAFIALGAAFSTTVTAGAAGMIPAGLIRVLGGLSFCLGLILVIVGGAELFTGNNLIIMAWASGEVSTARLLRNWLIVYFGNFAGAMLTAIGIFLSGQYRFLGGTIGLNALNTARSKVELDFLQAVMLGIFCNALVCLAVWLCYSARTTTDKILSIIFPITAFVAAGFEHSIANMYFIPVAILIQNFAPATFWEIIGQAPPDYAALTWGNFLLANLLPVTLGNIIGGSVLVGAVYWSVYLRRGR